MQIQNCIIESPYESRGDAPSSITYHLSQYIFGSRFAFIFLLSVLEQLSHPVGRSSIQITCTCHRSNDKCYPCYELTIWFPKCVHTSYECLEASVMINLVSSVSYVTISITINLSISHRCPPCVFASGSPVRPADRRCRRAPPSGVCVPIQFLSFSELSFQSSSSVSKLKTKFRLNETSS